MSTLERGNAMIRAWYIAVIALGLSIVGPAIADAATILQSVGG